MKIKNLLLAGLAIVAMSACSNENDEIVDNGQVNGTENATVRFSIGFPSASSRAEKVTDDGIKEEQTVTKLTAVLVYNDNSPVKVLTFGEGEITQDGTTATTSAKEVYGGVGIAYVYINPSMTIDATNYKTVQATAAYDSNTSLDGLIGTGGVAETNKFLMYGSNEFTATVGSKDNKATVSVSRIAAKLVETTTKEKATFTATNNDKLSITVQEYTFSNLNKTSNIFESTIFAPENDATGYFQNFVRTGKAWTEYLAAKKTIGGQDNITYCLENSKTATQVLYKAQMIHADNNKVAKNIYIVTDGNMKGTYANFDLLNKAYENQLTTAYGLSDMSSNDDFLKVGIKKYTNGICYYAANIQTEKQSFIERNNLYKLSVKSILDAGEPGIDTPEPGNPLTMLKLKIIVNPWTVNENAFDLQ